MQKPHSELAPLLRLALPVIFVNLANQTMGLVDTVMAGGIDALALAAVGLGGTVFFSGATLGMGIGMGIDPLASQAFGAGRARDARRTLWQGISAGALATLPVSGIVLALAYALEPLGVDPELARVAREYIFVRIPSLLPIFVIVALRAYLQAAKVTRPIVVSVIIANVLNFVLNWIFIHGDSGLVRLGLPAVGLPALGVRGLALATNLAIVFQIAWVGWAVRNVDPGPGEGSLRAPHAATIRKIFALGTPLGLQLLAECGIFATVGVLMAGIGKIPMAGHQVALSLASFTFMVPLGVAAATSVQVGRAIGRGDPSATRRAGIAGIGLGAAFMTVSALVLALAPEILAGFMSADPQVIASAATLIRIAGVFQIFDGIQVTASGALRGAGLTGWSLAANLVAYWLVALPVAIALGFGLHQGPAGLWWGLVIGLGVTAAALTGKFLLVSRRPIAALAA